MFQDVGLRFVALGAGEFRRDIITTRSALTGMESDLRKLSGSTVGFGTKLTTLGSMFSRTGQLLTTHLTLPITLLGGALVASGIQFEDAFAGVGKTVEGISDDFGNLTKEGIRVRDAFRQMALEIPVSVNELARIGEVAGQLGIKSSEIEDFTKTVALLGVTTDLTSEEAATFFARLGNIMGVAADDMAEFTKKAGSTVVDLGNKFAATEPEIAQLSLRLAGAGQALGLTTPEILAMATALASLGINAESGGSALSRVMLEMKRSTDDFVATGGEATDQLKLFAQAAGLTVDQFVALVKNSPEEAMLQLLGGVNRLQESGQLTNDMLKTMNLDTIRLQDVMNRLGPNIGFVRTALDASNKEWESGNALQLEAQKRFNTTKSQLILLKNAFVDLGIEIFYIYKGPIDGLIKGLRFLITSFTKMDDGILKSAIKFGLLLATIGPILAVLGSVLQVFGFLATAVGAVSTPILVIVGLVALLGYAFSTNFLGIHDVFDTLVKQSGKVIKSLKYIAYWVGKAFNWGKNLPGGNIFTGLAQAFKSLTYVFEDAKTTFFSKLLQAFGLSEEASQKLGMVINTILAPAFLFLHWILTSVGEIFNIVVTSIIGIIDSFIKYSTVIGYLTYAFNNFKAGHFELAFDYLKLAFEGFISWLANSGVRLIGQAIVDLSLALSGQWADVISFLVNGFIGGGNSLILSMLEGMINALPDWLSWFDERIVGPFMRGIENNTEKFFTNAGAITREFLAGIIDKLPDWATWTKENIVNPFIDKLLGRDTPDGALGKSKEAGFSISDVLTSNIAQTFLSIITGQWFLEHMITPFIEGFLGEENMNLIKTRSAEIINPIKQGMIDGWADIKAWVKTNLIDKLTTAITEDIPDIYNKAKEAGNSIVNGLKDGINELWSSFIDWLENEIVTQIPEPLRKFMGMDSPSKLMAQYGGWIVEGLQQGIEVSLPTLLSSIGGLSESISSALLSGTSGNMMSPYTNVPANNVTNISNSSTRVFSPNIYGANVSSDQAVGNEVLRAYRQAVNAHG